MLICFDLDLEIYFRLTNYKPSQKVSLDINFLLFIDSIQTSDAFSAHKLAIGKNIYLHV